MIEAAYDCVDRRVVNCGYPLGQAGSGLRTFWRQWQGGDSALSGQALRQAAGDLARRLKAHCQQQGILWIEGGPGDLKYEIAREPRPRDPAFRGVFAGLVGRAPASLWGGQAGSREMSVWRAKVRGTLAVKGGNEEGRMQNAEVRVEATPRPPSGHLVGNR